MLVLILSVYPLQSCIKYYRKKKKKKKKKKKCPLEKHIEYLLLKQPAIHHILLTNRSFPIPNIGVTSLSICRSLKKTKP